MIGVCVVVGIIFAVSVFFGYRYWQHGQPAYSLVQLQIAFQNKDTTSAQKYVDMDSIFNEFWPRVKVRIVQAYGNNIFYSTLIENQKTTLQDQIKNSFYDAVRNIGQAGAEPGIFPQLLAIKKPVFRINSSTADLKMDYHVNNKVYGFDFIFSRQPDRTWKITDIQGMEIVIEDSLVSQSRAGSQ